MTVTKADLIAILKSFIYGSQGAQLQQKAGTFELLTEDTGVNIREALRDAGVPNYLSSDQLGGYSLDDLYYNRQEKNPIAHSFGFTPSRIYRVEWTAPDVSIAKIRGLDITGQMYSRRAFRYPHLAFYGRFPAAGNLLSNCWVGFEPAGGGNQGLLGFNWSNGILNAHLTLAGGQTTSANLSTLFPALDPTAYNRLEVKVNRASVEFYTYHANYEGGLLAIIQSQEGCDRYTVRNAVPYFLAQEEGIIPKQPPFFLEQTSILNPYTPGGPTEFAVMGYWVSDGEESPQRTLHPYTGGVKWEGSVSNPSTTSDGIPIAGYDSKQVFFMASGAGTLEIYLDYGDNSYDLVATETVAANTLAHYLTLDEALWMQLKYTPTAPPKNITRARVLMR